MPRNDPPAPPVFVGGFARGPVPLLAPAIGLICGITFARYAHPPVVPVAIAAFAVAAGVFGWAFGTTDVRAGARLAVVAVTIFAVGAGVARYRAATTLAPDHVGRIVRADGFLAKLRATVVTTPVGSPATHHNPFLPYDPEPRTRFVAEAEAVRAGAAWRPLHGRLRVTVAADQLALTPGQSVELTGRLYRPRGPRNPGEVDWAALGRLRGIHAGMFLPSADLVLAGEPDHAWWRATLARARAAARASLLDALALFDGSDARSAAIEAPGQVLDAMLLGQRSAVDAALNEAFIRTGAVHFLTVSGFHVGVLGGAAWLVLRQVGGRRVAAGGTLLTLGAYALLAEPNAPILRATLMGALLCLGQLAERPPNPLNALALAALVLLWWSPQELFRGGFQLSFLQVAVLIMLLPPIWRRYFAPPPTDDRPRDADTWSGLLARRAWLALAGTGLVSVAAWLVSAPLVAQHFGIVAPWAPLFGLLITPLVTCVVLLGFVHLVAGVALGVATGPLLAGGTAVLVGVVGWLAAAPGTLLEVRAPGVWSSVLLVSGALVLLAWLGRAPGPAGRGRSDGGRAIARGPLLAGAALLAALAPPGMRALTRDARVRLLVLDVGNGSGNLVITPAGTLVVDLGTLRNQDVGLTASDALAALAAAPVTDILVSHANLDHFSGLPRIAGHYPGAAWHSNPFLCEAAHENVALRRLLAQVPADRPIAQLRRGDAFARGPVQVEVLHPSDACSGWSANDRSLVVAVAAYGWRLLIPGDAESAALAELLAAAERGELDLAADVLVAPHHGAVVPETGAFLEEVGPRLVLVSSARDRAAFATLVTEVLGPDVAVLDTRSRGALQVVLDRTGVTWAAAAERGGW